MAISKFIKILLKHRSKVYIFLLIGITLVLNIKGINEGDFQFSDASRHAMDGVYFSDLFKDRPLTNLYNYTIKYYAKYPALGLLIYYPPFFAVVEGIFFLLFGVSVVTARLTVAAFAILAVVMWYKLVKLIYNEKIAFFSGVLFVTTPLILYWSKQVMLEMPTLALIILSAYFFYNYVELSKKSFAYYLAASVIFAVLTKQTTIFILPIFFLYILIRKKHKFFFKKELIISSSIVLIFVILFLIFTLTSSRLLVNLSVGEDNSISRLSLSELFRYPKLLSQALTLPVLIFSIIGITITLGKRRFKKELLFLLWIICFYLVFSFLHSTVPRYTYFWIPPFCLFATLTLANFPWKVRKVSIATTLLGALCIFQVISGYNLTTPFISGYQEAARYVVDNPKGDTVLFDGWYDGNFIFYVRKYDNDKRIIVLRGSKLLYSFASCKQNWFTEHIKDEQDIYNLLNGYGTKYIVIEDKDITDTRPAKILREVLSSDNFLLVKTVKIKSDIPEFKDVSLNIYEYKNDIKMTKDRLILPMPGLRMKISVETEDLKL